MEDTLPSESFKRRRLAVVCSGGGMRCAYTAGAIVGLASKFQLIQPDIVVGGSGSAATLFYYLANQWLDIQKVWTESVASKRFISILRLWKIMDIDYLVDEVFRRDVKLNLERVRRTETQYFIAATNSETGELRYFNDLTDSCLIPLFLPPPYPHYYPT